MVGAVSGLRDPKEFERWSAGLATPPCNRITRKLRASPPGKSRFDAWVDAIGDAAGGFIEAMLGDAGGKRKRRRKRIWLTRRCRVRVADAASPSAMSRRLRRSARRSPANADGNLRQDGDFQPRAPCGRGREDPRMAKQIVAGRSTARGAYLSAKDIGSKASSCAFLASIVSMVSMGFRQAPRKRVRRTVQRQRL